MLTKLPLLVLAVSIAAHGAKKKDYENFSLPSRGKAIVPEVRDAMVNTRVTLKDRKVRVYEPSVNAQTYMFQKEAFLSEKRDEAIRLLRIQIDTGGAQNRANTYLRLGQLYAEKYMELSFRENELFSELLRKHEVEKQTNKKAVAPKLDTTRSQRYLKDALGIFYRLEKEYPKHPKMDEIIYFIGFVEMESGSPAKGARYLERVVSQYPRSKKFDEAVVYLGDTYFEKHKFTDAAKKYRILLSRKDASMHDYGTYKLAWCDLNMGKQRAGLNSMRGLVQRLAGASDKAKFNLREQALKDLVIFYGEVEDVDGAMRFFTETQGKEKAYENLKLIADILKSKARDVPAAKAYAELLREFGDTTDAPRLTLGLYDTYARLGKNQQAADLLATAIQKYGDGSAWSKSFGSDKAAEVKAAQDLLSSEAVKIAMFHHQAGQKSANKGHYHQALSLYNALLAHYPNLPERKKVAFYKGEIQFNEGKWLDAAEAYMVAAKMAPKDKLTDESVYNAVLSLDRLTAKSEKIERLSKEDMKNASVKSEEIPSAEKRFIEVAEYYLTEYPKGDRVVDVRFRIASIYYKHRHYDLAQAGFREIALKYPTHRSAATSAHLVLDIYNVKKDFDSMNKEAGIFASTKGLGDSQFKAEMATIAGEIAFKSIEKLETASQWGAAGDEYLKFYKANPTGALSEKSLYNAIIAYEKGNEVGKSADAAAIFLAKFPKSNYSQRLILANAKNAERLYDFETAQKLYLDFAHRFPSDKEARKSLYNAAVYAELLEWNKQAIELYTEYMRKPVPDDEAKSIEISLAKLHRKQGNFDKMVSGYRKMSRAAKTVEDKMAYLAELARHLENAGKMSERNNIVLELRSMYENADPKPRGAGVQYVAEARLKAIEGQRKKYEEIPLRFPPEDLVYLLKRKQKSLSKLSAKYDEVVEVGVPEWGVAALLEKSNAYDHFVQMYRKVQVPKKYKPEEAVEADKSLKQIDAQMIQPLEKTSQDILKSCVARAAEFRVMNEYASKCGERVRSTEKEVVVSSPSGLLPQPTYWSTRSGSEGIARR